MKTKSALFISAVLTAFVLAILVGVASAFNTAKTSEVAAVASPTQEVVLPTDTPTQPDPTATQQPAQVSPQQAASIAAQFMNKTDVYSVESATINGVNAYKVVFSSGDIVFVGLDGKIISTAKSQPTTIVSVAPTIAPQQNHNHPGGGGGHGGGGGGGHGGDDGGGHDN